MPPKRKSSSVTNRKNTERKSTKTTKERAGDEQNGVRKRAKNCNQSYLKGALNAAMTQVNGGSYSAAGLTFVAVNSANNSAEKDRKNSPDPLDLSQKAAHDRKRNKTRKRPTTGKNATGSYALEVSDDDTTESTVRENNLATVTAASPDQHQESPMDDIVDDIVESSQPLSMFLVNRKPCNPSSQPRKLAIPNVDALDDDSLDEWGHRQSRHLAIKCPTPGGAASSYRRKHPVGEISTTDEPGTTVSAPKPGMSLVCPGEALRQSDVAEMSTSKEQRATTSTPKSGMAKDRPRVCPDEASSQSDDSDSEDGDEGSFRSKYFDLLERYKHKSEAHKQLKKKYERQKLSMAEMKDLVVFANIETKKAHSDPNAKLIFTTDPEIEINVQQIEEISSASKNDVAFGQNMALFFYGAQKLQTMSVSGVATNRFKNAKSRPGISPKKLAFIYEKVQQRVASRVGANNLAQITTLANPTRINKGIAEKISNLRKAAKYAAARNIMGDADQQPNATRDPTK